MRNLLAVVVVALASCAASEPMSAPAALDGAGEPLRAQFDAAAGKVRAILLPAPT